MALANPPSAGAQALQPFGKYLLDAELAQGGMARVFRARLRGPGGFEKRLVVKQILQELAQDPAFIELFVREANTLVQMSHPNVVPVYELGVVDGVYFLAMELVEGATVAELLRDGALPEALCAHLGAQVCDALRYAHERFGLVHRDVSPRNVMADADGHVRLLDFGIAAPLAHAGSGELFGSPGYMSPEQTRGGTLSAQSDLFSLGSVLYEALTGRPALGSREQPEAKPAPIEGASAELAALVHALLAAEPAARPGSAAEVGARLRTWLSHNHPEGVARALGARVDQARARGEQQSAPGAPVRIESTPGATPRLTRSIATSRQLSEMLGGSTEPLARPLPAPGEAARSSAPARRARNAVPWMLALVALALATSLLVTRGGDRENASARAPGAATTRSHDRAGVEAPAASVPTASPPATMHATGPAPAAGVNEAPAPAAPPAGSQRAGGAPATHTSAATAGLAPTSSVNGTAADAAASAAAEPSARARLSVNALPWAELRLDGRPLGATPKRAMQVSSGNHVLLLECPPLGRRARVPLKLTADEHRHVLVDLNADPPTVTLR
jgi:eukaryotic-like serine/threonine-protein kinase